MIRKYIKIGKRKDDVSSYVNKIERLASKNDVKIHHMQILSYAAHLKKARIISGKPGIEEIQQRIISYILAYHRSPAANQVEKWVERLKKK